MTLVSPWLQWVCLASPVVTVAQCVSGYFVEKQTVMFFNTFFLKLVDYPEAVCILMLIPLPQEALPSHVTLTEPSHFN